MNHFLVKVGGTGTYLPGEPIPYEEIPEYLGELPDAPESVQKWYKRTHKAMKNLIDIKFCHYVLDPKTRELREDNIDLSKKACLEAIDKANLCISDIDVLIYGGSYSCQIPPMSSILQEALGLKDCSELHINSNCTSIYKAILIAHDFLRIGRYKNALVVSSNISSAFLRSEYYNQSKIQKKDLFLRNYLCDGAGAIVLQSTDTMKEGFYLESTYMESPGCEKMAVMGPSFPAYPVNPAEVYEKGLHHVVQLFEKELGENFMEEENTIFFNGLKRMLKREKIDAKEITSFLINMPTNYVVDLILQECESIGIRKDSVFTSLGNVGYTGPPAAIITLDNLLRVKNFSNQDLILSFVTEVSKFLQAGFAIRYVN